MRSRARRVWRLPPVPRTREPDRGRESNELAIPERHLGLGQLELLACDAQERVALLEDVLKLTHLATMRAVDLPENGVHEAAARARRGPEELDVLGKERDDHELAGHILRPFRGTIEQVAARPSALAFGRREEQRFDAAVVFGA